jgi:hypothetical protein
MTTCACLVLLVACGGGNGGEDDTVTEADGPGDVTPETWLDATPEPEPDLSDPAPEDVAEDPEAEDAAEEAVDGDDDAPGFCPDISGAVVFRMEEAWVPSPGEAVRELLIPCAGGLTFGSIVVEMDLTHAGWDETSPDATHGIFQLQRDSRWRSNLYGYMTMFGPTRNEVKVISNIDLGAGEVVRLNRRPVRLAEDTTYHVRYTYDTTIGERRLVLTAGGETVLDMSDANTVSDVTTLAPGFELHLGSPDLGDTGPEVPIYGWTFENLCVQILP